MGDGDGDGRSSSNSSRDRIESRDGRTDDAVSPLGRLGLGTWQDEVLNCQGMIMIYNSSRIFRMYTMIFMAGVLWPSVAVGVVWGVIDFDFVSSEPSWLKFEVGVEVGEREMKRGK